MPNIVVIGAGIGGLAAGAALAKAGLDVTVLEAQPHPGGCAATFSHQGCLFDAGATLALGFYPGGPMHLLAEAAGIAGWPVRPVEPAIVVHLPDGLRVARWTTEARWQERRTAFGSAAERFWRWQERTSAALWDLAMRIPPWPPQTAREMAGLVGHACRWLASNPKARLRAELVADLNRPVAAHLSDAPARMRQFVDAQLLISAQTTSARAHALYGAAALDLPRRGPVHLVGGMGTISVELARALAVHGGTIHYRQKARRIVFQGGRPRAVETHDGQNLAADTVIANLPTGDVARLVEPPVPRSIRGAPPWPDDGWGAFTAYVDAHSASISPETASHHQVILGESLVEGSSIFLSLSPEWDATRAPSGRRAVTISTHTRIRPWWELFERDPTAYEHRKQAYTERVLALGERAVPGLRNAVRNVISGTPLTFAAYTHRSGGWVGGYPQTHLCRAKGPRIGPGFWMVGDSVFPGQSTAAVALGALRVARAILRESARVGSARKPWCGRKKSDSGRKKAKAWV